MLLCFVWAGVNIVQVVMFCIVVWLYVFLGCTRACVCRCDGDVICVRQALNRVLDSGMSAVWMLHSVGERTPPLRTPVLNWCCMVVWFLYGV